MSSYEIIKDARIFAEFVPISYSYDLDEMRPHFEMVAEQYLIPECGRPLWDELLLAQENGSPTGKQLEALRALQRPFANLCMLSQLPFLDAKISSGGITVTSSQDQAPASQARVVAIQRQLWSTAFQAMDRLIFFLIENEADLTAYQGTVWAMSKRAGLLNSTEEAGAFIPAISNRWLFRKLQPIMARVAAGEILAAITAPIYADILRSISDQDAPNLYEPLLHPLRAALTHLSWAQGLLELGLEASPAGVMTFGTTLGTIADTAGSKLKDPERAAIMAHHERIGRTSLQNVVDALQAGTATWPLYELDEAYTADHMPAHIRGGEDKIWAPFL
jgi:hypothetical protein